MLSGASVKIVTETKFVARGYVTNLLRKNKFESKTNEVFSSMIISTMITLKCY